MTTQPSLDPTDLPPDQKQGIRLLGLLHRVVLKGQKRVGPMTVEDVLEMAREKSLPEPLQDREWVDGGLRFLRALGVVRERNGEYMALAPAAAAANIRRTADLLVG